MPRPSLASLLAPGAFDRPVDQVGAEARAAKFTKRSIKTDSKVQGLRMVVSMTDLTTLEGSDSAGKVRQMCTKAVRPDPRDPSVPAVAAVCVYPSLVSVAKSAVTGSTVKVASVATSFPSGQIPFDERLDEVRRAVETGADEIDMVINRGAFMQGDYRTVFDEISGVKEACGPAHLKVILETGELETYDSVRRASHLAMEAGADFIKTSTGKVSPAATMPVTLVMLEAIREHWWDTGRKVGMKPAGGIRSAKQALHYLVMVKETLGDEWLTPDLFRFGASSLLNDVLMQLTKQRTGAYQSAEYYTLD
ncbi:MAG TPA: deoxyribose-phosphate aldolase [Fimbriimonadaceae bacterium]|nr:deoxyribose-phosphate aldolase [Fimbriimonadaceae bacterium]